MKRSSRIQDPAKMADLASGAQVDDVKVTKEGAGFDTPAGTAGAARPFQGRSYGGLTSWAARGSAARSFASSWAVTPWS